MPDSPYIPHDPAPERTDALGEQARAGFQEVAGDHEAALSRLKARLEASAAGNQGAVQPTSQQAKVRDITTAPRRRQRWLAPVAAAAAVVLAVAIYFSYESQEQPVAARVDTTQSSPAPSAPTATDATKPLALPPVAESASRRSETMKEQVEMTTEEAASGVDKDASLGNVAYAPPEIQETDAAPTAPASQAPPILRKTKIQGRDEEIVLADETRARTQRRADESEAPQRSAPTDEVVDASYAESPAASDNSAPSSESAYAKQDGDDAFQLQRDQRRPVRTIGGRVVDLTGDPVVGARVFVEDTGQLTRTDDAGRFELDVLSGATVVLVSGGRDQEVRFDATAADRFNISLAMHTGQRSEVFRPGSQTALPPVFPQAPAFDAFDQYAHQPAVMQQADDQLSEVLDDTALLQFRINRLGRPKSITKGPGEVSDVAFRAARELLQNGPDWPEAYRRKNWRYPVPIR